MQTETFNPDTADYAALVCRGYYIRAANMETPEGRACDRCGKPMFRDPDGGLHCFNAWSNVFAHDPFVIAKAEGGAR